MHFEAMPSNQPGAEASGVRFWIMLTLIVGGIIAASMWMGGALSRLAPRPGLPVLVELKKDLVATERDGQEVRFSDLRGKVVVCSYVYTVCPHGCAAVIAQMQRLLNEHRGRKDFHMVSVAVVPDRDTPQFFQSYAEAIGVRPGDPWWFLTGDRDALWGFMTEGLKLEPAMPIPEDERLNPLDLYQHDLRVVLIDHQGRVRRYYAVFHPQPEIAKIMCGNLLADVRLLLEHPSP